MIGDTVRGRAHSPKRNDTFVKEERYISKREAYIHEKEEPMSIEGMQMAAILCFILAGILGMLAGVLFFSWNVRKLIGDMTGSNARKEIQIWREENKKIQVWKEKDRGRGTGKEENGNNDAMSEEKTERLSEKTTLLGESIYYLVEEYCFLASEEIIH